MFKHIGVETDAIVERMKGRITNGVAREIINLWLTKHGKPLPDRRLNYIDFANEVLRITRGEEPNYDSRPEACAFLRILARRILDEKRLAERERGH